MKQLLAFLIAYLEKKKYNSPASLFLEVLLAEYFQMAICFNLKAVTRKLIL